MIKQLDLFKTKITYKWYKRVMRGEGTRRVPYLQCQHCKMEIFDDGKVLRRKSCPICSHKGMVS